MLCNYRGRSLSVASPHQNVSSTIPYNSRNRFNANEIWWRTDRELNEGVINPSPMSISRGIGRQEGPPPRVEIGRGRVVPPAQVNIEIGMDDRRPLLPASKSRGIRWRSSLLHPVKIEGNGGGEGPVPPPRIEIKGIQRSSLLLARKSRRIGVEEGSSLLLSSKSKRTALFLVPKTEGTRFPPPPGVRTEAKEGGGVIPPPVLKSRQKRVEEGPSLLLALRPRRKWIEVGPVER